MNPLPGEPGYSSVDDLNYMNAALDLARRGCGFTSPNPMVGAVVVNQGRVVGRGFHRAVGMAHAEVEALQDAGDAARGATLYVTLEPCNHAGRTPPCTEAILTAGIRRVVVAMRDPNPDVAGGGIERLLNAGLAVDIGIGAAEASRLNEAFIQYVVTKRPFVTLKCAATLDGRIATKSGDAKWITGDAARAHVHRMRHAADGIVVGVGTVKTDDPQLTTRLPDETGADPVRYVLDAHLTIPKTARILDLPSAAPTVLVTGPGAAEESKAALTGGNTVVVEMPAKDGFIDWHAFAAYLGEKHTTGLLIEGGSRVIASALRAGIVDKVVFFFAPKILGGDDGVPICAGPGPQWIKDSIPLSDIRVERFDDDIMIEGYVKRPF